MEHLREVRRHRKAKGVYGEKLVFAFGTLAVYRDVYIPLK
jgi:hypothetical protein